MSEVDSADDSPPINTNTSSDTPFEWLTNFRSLRHLVLPSRIVFGSSASPKSKPKNDDRTTTDAASSAYAVTSHNHASESKEGPDNVNVRLNALHVGCGTSTVGESLLGLREWTDRNRLFQYGRVVNVDNDEYALDGMRRRWERRRPPKLMEGDDDGADRTGRNGVMEWKRLDFKDEGSCRLALDGCATRRIYENDDDATTSSACDPPPAGGRFDLVLDKSTLDCLLCAETNVVAQFLHEAYRALRVPDIFSEEGDPNAAVDVATADRTSLPSSWGGMYVVVTFHPAEFVERLLTGLPGADWRVEHEVIKREVGDLNGDGVWKIDEVTHRSTNDTSAGSVRKEELKEIPSSTSAWASGTFHPDENYRKTVTVFTCRRCNTKPPRDKTSSSPSYILDRERIRDHVERTCDEWYQTTNPMVTSEREEQLRILFLKEAASKIAVRNETGGDGDTIPNDALLDLKQCYEILFTDAEKEHLTYEYFIEDWDAYCERARKDDDDHCREGMNFAIALDFLKEMQ